MPSCKLIYMHMHIFSYLSRFLKPCSSVLYSLSAGTRGVAELDFCLVAAEIVVAVEIIHGECSHYHLRACDFRPCFHHAPEKIAHADWQKGFYLLAAAFCGYGFAEILK